MTLIYVLSGYLLGSIPIAWLITKLHTGEDLRVMGSGNVGVSNVALSVARWAGLLVFLSEICKGMIVVLVLRYLNASALQVYAAVLAAIFGTRWSVWLRFAGGRGNSVGFGAMILLSWQTFVIGAVVWILARLILRSSFWATRVCLISWPVIFGLLVGSWLAFIFGALVAITYLSTHEEGTDDHLIIKEQWPSLIAFLLSPRRK
ncbi:MAG: glycerol-3-phosphate acyltransferase [Anaerolineaceae bacterium]|nr:MAG: glycerol-3-phosphate acyltransferase [Anaerolineaceae bacterium]